MAWDLFRERATDAENLKFVIDSREKEKRDGMEKADREKEGRGAGR